MEHSEEVAAVITANEPATGTVLIVKDSSEWKAIVRDDAAAKQWGAAPGDRWFNGEDGDDDPMSLYEHIKYADAVYALGEPLAVFR